MKYGFRTPSIKKRIGARTSFKRYVRHNLGVKAPRGIGILTSPRKALYSRAYNRTTRKAGCRGCGCTLPILALLVGLALLLALPAFARADTIVTFIEVGQGDAIWVHSDPDLGALIGVYEGCQAYDHLLADPPEDLDGVVWTHDR